MWKALYVLMPAIIIAMAGSQAEGEAVVLEGVDKYQVCEPMFEGVRVILSYLGAEYSPAYIQGISGTAFRVAGICPCAPTCNLNMEPKDLVKMLGYDCEYLTLRGEGIEPKKEVHNVVARVKENIRSGRPVLVWHAFTNAEWDVVCGFDEEKKEFVGRGSYLGMDDYARAEETRTIKCAQLCDPLGAVIIKGKIGEFDARKAEIASLKEAVRHAHSRKGEAELKGNKWVFLEGLMAYDRWIEDFRNPEKKREVDDSYCYGIYKSTHRAAASFLKEICPKYPEASAYLNEAAECFRTEAKILDEGADMLWWSAPEGPDPERNEKVVKLLSAARKNYAEGIDKIELAVKEIEAK